MSTFCFLLTSFRSISSLLSYPINIHILFQLCDRSSTVFEAAQPALLYLVPACLGSSLLCATARGELKELFDYSEEEEEEEEVEEKKDEKSKKDD